MGLDSLTFRDLPDLADRAESCYLSCWLLHCKPPESHDEPDWALGSRVVRTRSMIIISGNFRACPRMMTTPSFMLYNRSIM